MKRTWALTALLTGSWKGMLDGWQNSSSRMRSHTPRSLSDRPVGAFRFPLPSAGPCGCPSIKRPSSHSLHTNAPLFMPIPHKCRHTRTHVRTHTRKQYKHTHAHTHTHTHTHTLKVNTVWETWVHYSHTDSWIKWTNDVETSLLVPVPATQTAMATSRSRTNSLR